MNDLSNCFECGRLTTNRHHIIPVSRGGRNTIPLCPLCHRKAHNEDGETCYKSELILEGLARARAVGVKLGAPVKHCEPLLPLYNKGMSLRQIAKRVGLSVGGVHKKLKKEIQDVIPSN